MKIYIPLVQWPEDDYPRAGQLSLEQTSYVPSEIQKFFWLTLKDNQEANCLTEALIEYDTNTKYLILKSIANRVLFQAYHLEYHKNYQESKVLRKMVKAVLREARKFK